MRFDEMTIADVKMTIADVKQLASLLGGITNSDNSYPWKVGSKYLIRTVTMYYTGKLESVTGKELVLSSAAWIADTGRYYDALKKGLLNEVEPIIGPVIVGRGAIVDAVEWAHDLPDEQK